jgi:hypothetical protein
MIDRFPDSTLQLTSRIFLRRRTKCFTAGSLFKPELRNAFNASGHAVSENSKKFSVLHGRLSNLHPKYTPDFLLVCQLVVARHVWPRLPVSELSEYWLIRSRQVMRWG